MKGDGKAADTAAIALALDTARKAGGTVYLPRGTYLIYPNLGWQSGLRPGRARHRRARFRGMRARRRVDRRARPRGPDSTRAGRGRTRPRRAAASCRRRPRGTARVCPRRPRRLRARGGRLSGPHLRPFDMPLSLPPSRRDRSIAVVGPCARTSRSSSAVFTPDNRAGLHNRGCSRSRQLTTPAATHQSRSWRTSDTGTVPIMEVSRPRGSTPP